MLCTAASAPLDAILCLVNCAIRVWPLRKLDILFVQRAHEVLGFLAPHFCVMAALPVFQSDVKRAAATRSSMRRFGALLCVLGMLPANIYQSIF